MIGQVASRPSNDDMTGADDKPVLEIESRLTGKLTLACVRLRREADGSANIDPPEEVWLY